MNSWFDRFSAGLPEGGCMELTREEAVLVLDLAGAAARSAGARQYAPLATYLAGRAAAGSVEERTAVLRSAIEAARSAGEGEALELG